MLRTLSILLQQEKNAGLSLYMEKKSSSWILSCFENLSGYILIMAIYMSIYIYIYICNQAIYVSLGTSIYHPVSTNI